MIYTDFHSLKTSDGTTTNVIAGETRGYREGVGAKAKFKSVTGFVQLSGTRLVVVDSHNHCLRMVERPSGQTSPLHGQCQNSGYADGNPGLFHYPNFIAVDKISNNNQLLVTDIFNDAIRTVDMIFGFVGNFVRSPSLRHVFYFTQHERGDIYATEEHSVVKITCVQANHTTLRVLGE